MSHSIPFRSELRSDTTTYYHLVETRISYDNLTGKRIVESDATYLTEEHQEQARLLAESASRVKKVSSPLIEQSGQSTASTDLLKSPSLLSTAAQLSPHQIGGESNAHTDTRPKQPKASPGLLSNLAHTVLTINKDKQPAHSTNPIEPVADRSLVDLSSADSSDVETLSDDDIGSVNEDSNGLYPIETLDLSILTSSRSSGSSSPQSLSDPVDASDNHPLMASYTPDLSSKSPLPLLSTQPQSPREMAADTSTENARTASPGFFSSLYNTLFAPRREISAIPAWSQPSKPELVKSDAFVKFSANPALESFEEPSRSTPNPPIRGSGAPGTPLLEAPAGITGEISRFSGRPIQPLEDNENELKLMSSNNIAEDPLAARHGTVTSTSRPVIQSYQVIESYIPQSPVVSVIENPPIVQGSTVVSSPLLSPLVQNTTISSTISPTTPQLTNEAQVTLPQPQPSLSPVMPTASTTQLPQPQLSTLPLVSDASEDFSTAPKVQLPGRPLPQLLPSPSEPSDQTHPVSQPRTTAVSNNSSPDQQPATIVLERVLPERAPLVLDTSLNTEQIARIDEYRIQPLVPELSDEELAQLTPQKLMTRALNARQEPSMLKETITDLQGMLNELTELKDSIAAAQREAQSQPLLIAQIRKNAENIGLSKARMMLILNRIYPGRDSDELKTIAENECVALAQKYIIQAQDRLQELATRNSVPKTAKVVIQDTAAVKLASLRKQLKLTTGSIGTANGSLGRAKRAIPPLERKIAELQEDLNTITANGDHEKLEATLSKFNAEEKLLEEKVNEVPAQEKKILVLQAKKDKLDIEIDELEATQSLSAKSGERNR